MSRIFGRTASEIRSTAIAKALVIALVRFEASGDDPDEILEAAELFAGDSSLTKSLSSAQRIELQKAVRILTSFYRSEEEAAS